MMLPGFRRYRASRRPEHGELLEARLGAAADLSCDVVVGHSLGANVAVEIVSASEFSAPVVLLSPSFSRHEA
jgi:predicted alpha/beta superfamily hydrolase